MAPTITRDADLCIKCGTCVLTCYASVHVQESKDSIPEVINPGFCISDGYCVAICPKNAIVHSEFLEGYVKPVDTENMPSSEEVLELLRTRRSIRVFKDKPVERQLIEGIIEAARFAPSQDNSQTTEFIVVQDKELLENIVQAAGNFCADSLAKLRNPLMRRILPIVMRVPAQVVTEKLMPEMEYIVAEIQRGRDPIFLHNAPLLILFHAEERPMSSVDINTSLALHNAALMAYSQGLGSFYAGFLAEVFRRDKSIQQLVKLPANHKVYGALPIGYPRFKFKKWPERRAPRITWL
jgi:nitroreductase/NAD-dependent dihydropyrimidine dehydrogenase PreA subunit